MRGDAADLSNQGSGREDEVVSIHIEAGSHTPFCSEPIRSGGQAALFEVEVTHKKGSATSTVRIDHRAAGDTAWTTAGTFLPGSSSRVQAQDKTGFKEWWRWVLTPDRTQDRSVALVRMRPIWKPKSSSETRTKE